MNNFRQRGDIELVLQLTLLGLILGSMLVFAGINIYGSLATHRTETITVKRSERVSEGKSARYLIFANEGVYENTDDWWNHKFNSSDLYSDIEVGKTYSCDVVGWRNGFFSWYPNLISCEEAKKS